MNALFVIGLGCIAGAVAAHAWLMFVATQKRTDMTGFTLCWALAGLTTIPFLVGVSMLLSLAVRLP